MEFGGHIHGWTNREQISKVMSGQGYIFSGYGERENATDGEADLIYVKNGNKYRLDGNYWDYKTFKFPWNQPDKVVGAV